MQILKIDVNRHLTVMRSDYLHLLTGTIFHHVTEYLNKVFCGFQTGTKIKCFTAC